MESVVVVAEISAEKCVSFVTESFTVINVMSNWFVVDAVVSGNDDGEMDDVPDSIGKYVVVTVASFVGIRDTVLAVVVTVEASLDTLFVEEIAAGVSTGDDVTVSVGCTVVVEALGTIRCVNDLLRAALRSAATAA